VGGRNHTTWTVIEGGKKVQENIQQCGREEIGII
jgi:hypothetical protein